MPVNFLRYANNISAAKARTHTISMRIRPSTLTPGFRKFCSGTSLANTGAVVRSGRGAEVAMGDRIMVPQKKSVNVWGFVKDAGIFLANLATIYIVVDQAVH